MYSVMTYGILAGLMLFTFVEALTSTWPKPFLPCLQHYLRIKIVHLLIWRQMRGTIYISTAGIAYGRRSSESLLSDREWATAKKSLGTLKGRKAQ